MGRYTEIAVPESFINYSRKLPETLMLDVINNIDKQIADNKNGLDNIFKALNVKLAPTENAQRDFQEFSSNILKKKDDIVNQINTNKADFNTHKNSIKALSDEIGASLVNGKLKALTEQGAEYYEAENKFKTDFKDNPELYKLASNKLNANAQKNTYIPELGTYGRLELPNMVKNIPQEDIVKHYSGVLKSVAEKTGLDDIRIKTLVGRRAEDLIGIGGQDKIDYDKIVGALKGATLTEHIASLNQQNEAAGYVGVDGKIFDEGRFLNDDGTLNTNSKIGRIINGLGIAGEQEKVTTTQMSNADPNRRASSSDNTPQQAVDPYNSWDLYNTTLPKLSKAMMTATPETRQVMAQQLLKTVDNVVDKIFDVRTYANQPGVKSGDVKKVYPFTKGRVTYVDVNNKSINNDFEDQDIVFEFSKTGKGRVSYFNPAKAVIDTTPLVGSRFIQGRNPIPLVSNNSREYNTFFNLDVPSDVKELKKLLFKAGYQTNQFYPNVTYFKGGNLEDILDNIKEPETAQPNE